LQEAAADALVPASLPSRDRVHSTVLASRQQTCVHPKVSAMSGQAASNACRALVAARKCHWHNQLKFSKNREWAGVSASIPDIEDLVEVGKQHKVHEGGSTREGTRGREHEGVGAWWR
jgi:hypothetical protein